MRHVRGEDSLYLDEDSTFKRACCQGETDEDIFVTSDDIKFKGKFLNMLKRVCQ